MYLVSPINCYYNYINVECLILVIWWAITLLFLERYWLNFTSFNWTHTDMITITFSCCPHCVYILILGCDINERTNIHPCCSPCGYLPKYNMDGVKSPRTQCFRSYNILFKIKKIACLNFRILGSMDRLATFNFH